MKANSPALFFGILFAYAASFATFLNVVIFRMPFILDKQWCDDAKAFLEYKSVQHDEIKLENPMYSTIGGRSHCPTCFEKIPLYYNVPILGWLLLKGKSNCCKKPIPVRYIGFELFFTVMVLGLFYVLPLEHAFFMSVYLFIAISIAMIDLKTTFIPDSLTYTLLWMGLFASYNNVVVSPDSAILAVIGSYVFLYGIAKSYELVRGVDAMGSADFKLIAAVAAWSGFEATLYILVSSCVITLILTLFNGFLRKIPGLNNINGAPFGPGLMISGFSYTLYLLL